MSLRAHKFSATHAIALAMVLGIAAGISAGQALAPIKIVGDVFFRLIQQCMVIFVMGQIISAIGSLGKRDLGSIGIKAIALFLVSSLLASAFGLLCAEIAQPGNVGDASSILTQSNANYTATTVSIEETILGFFSSNIFASMTQGAMVPCIVFSVLFGIGIIIYKETHDGSCGILIFVDELNDVVLNMIKLVMKLAPIGVFAYVAASIGSLGAHILLHIGKYLIVLAVATLLFTILWVIVIFVRCQLNPIKLMRKMGRMSLVAAATISSAVTLPTEMEDAKERLGIQDSIASLVLSLGMPLNSNGSALHMSVTALFVAQLFGIHFDLGMLVYVAVICWLLSLANAVAPGATLISLTMLMPALGLPLEAIALLGGLEYLVAAIRTTLNVNSDVFCALLVAKSEGALDREVFENSK